MQVESYASANGAWVLNRAAPSNSSPGFFIPRTSGANDAVIAARIENDVLFRVLAVNYPSTNSARIEAWDLDTGLPLVSFPINASLVLNQGVFPNSFRPEISYSPTRNKLYIVSVQYGALLTMDMNTGNAQQILLPTGNFGVRDVEIDTSRDVAYLAMRATSSGTVATNIVGANLVSNEVGTAGKLYELNLANNVVTRQVSVGIGPWQIAMAPVSGYMHVFLTNYADEPNNANADSVSQIDVNTFQTVRKLPTLNQPTAISVQWLD